MTVHAGCVALWSAQGWRGVLIEGPSGSGKSDLALRLIGRGWRLVSDDRTILWRSQGRLFAACPPTIAGRIEVRGLGVVAEEPLALAEVVLVARCEPPAERMPEEETVMLCGAPVPLVRLDPLEASAPAKLRRAVASLGQAAQGAYLPAAAGAARGVPVKGRL